MRTIWIIIPGLVDGWVPGGHFEPCTPPEIHRMRVLQFVSPSLVSFRCCFQPYFFLFAFPSAPVPISYRWRSDSTRRRALRIRTVFFLFLLLRTRIAVLSMFTIAWRFDGIERCLAGWISHWIRRCSLYSGIRWLELVERESTAFGVLLSNCILRYLFCIIDFSGHCLVTINSDV